ncbi:hypothetical protein RFM41_26545 [Mesorhizobium sp. VK25A]|uniref:Uncharacterized protein n=1 Tax=Mesorhizobium vachelliae TaxID=3072309 RepID=A0ABU5AAN9_9HYPH|nr:MULTISPECIES: hypothetical protein [unclassified Mesorhizobium]MDX8534781.1 hypothetical protein [Mesorhizobium sp. VK25D]MDX8547336.1 hypothetical protein [Mesorhizobium sp. VK25A]
MSSSEPFPEQQFLFREPFEVPANDNGALRDLSMLNPIPADDELAKVAAKAERMGFAVAVGIAIGLFIGPVVFTCLMLGIWNAAVGQ